MVEGYGIFGMDGIANVMEGRGPLVPFMEVLWDR